MISKPFLRGEQETDPSERKASIGWIFLIFGSFALASTVFQLLILLVFGKYILSREEIVSNDEDSNNHSLQKKIFDSSSVTSRRVFIALSAVSFGLIDIVVKAHSQFGPTFSQFIPLKLTASDAAQIQTYMSTSLAIGRGITVLLSLKLHPRSILLGDF